LLKKINNKNLYFIYFIMIKSDIDSSREESDLFTENVKIKIRGYDKKEDIWKGMVNMNKDVNILYNNYIQSINVKIENIKFNGLELHFFPDPFRPNFFHILYYNKNKELEGVSYKGKIIPQNDMYISNIWFKVKLIINGNSCHTYLSVLILDKSGGSTPKIKYSNISRPGNNNTGKINLDKGNVSILLPKDIDFERLNQGFTANYNTMYRTFSFQNIEGYKCYIDKDYGLFNLFKGYKNVEISNIGENCCIYYYNGNEYHKVSSSKTDIKKDESNTTGSIIGIGILLIIISVLY
ncbi:hypothetical protein SLOPH_931, partial [Spraguea lophii 42_110]